MSEEMPINWTDLCSKVRCLMDFSREVCFEKEYKDWFLISIKNSYGTEREKTINLLWFCPGLDKTNAADTRDHEALLGKYFDKYNLTIEKKPGRWAISIATPHPYNQLPPVVRVVSKAKRSHSPS